MKKVSLIPVVSLLIILFCASGCKKTNTLLTGNLYGFVTLYDQYGARVAQGVNASTITLVSSANSQSISATTDTNGKYTFNNVTEGQYALSCVNGAGYGSFNNAALGFLGGGNIDHDIKLSAIPNFYDSILSTPVDTLNNIVLNGTFSGTDTRKRTYVVFVGTSLAVSSAPATYVTFYSGTANNNFTTFTQKINVSDLYDAGFTSGSTVYFAVYGAAADFNTTSNAEDYTTGKLNFTAISSNVAYTSIVLP